jgi:hypothetical protein
VNWDAQAEQAHQKALEGLKPKADELRRLVESMCDTLMEGLDDAFGETALPHSLKAALVSSMSNQMIHDAVDKATNEWMKEQSQ